MKTMHMFPCFIRFLGAILALLLCSRASSQVSLTATAGTLTGSYPNLYAAFNAINNGTHQGDINIRITANFTENSGTLANLRPLNSSFTGSANYSSITIRPQGNVTITSNNTKIANRGLYEFFGADNITIDGDDPDIPGIARNLTIQSAPSTVASNFALIRLASVNNFNGIDNFTIKNCVLRGSRNTFPNTTVMDEIIISNTTTSYTDQSQGITNLTIENNEFLRSNRAINLNNNLANTGINWQIKNNIIGSSTAVQMISFVGILLRGGTNILVENNDLQVGMGNSPTGVDIDVFGILVFDEVPGLMIRSNNIHDIINLNDNQNKSIVGIFLNTNTNADGIQISNNFIHNLVQRRKLNGFIAGFYAQGNRANNFQFVNNTINLEQTTTLGTSTQPFTFGFRILPGSGIRISNFSNNIIKNNFSGNNSFCFFVDEDNLASGCFFDYNVYYAPNCNVSNGLFALPAGTFSTLANWRMLSNRDQNSGVENIPFVAPLTNIHIRTDVPTKTNDKGLFSTLAPDDIDGEARSFTATDIGADQFGGITYSPIVLNAVSAAAISNLCLNQPRTISANITRGNAFDTALLFYSFNGVNQTPIGMIQNSAGIFDATIPAAPTDGALVSYRVRVTSKNSDTIFSQFYTYQLNQVKALTKPVALPDRDSVCANDSVLYTLKYPDGVGINDYLVPDNFSEPTNGADIITVKIEETSTGNVVMENNSTRNSLSGTYGTATGTAGSYANYTALHIDTLRIGVPYDVTLVSGTNNHYPSRFLVQLDFNKNGVFDANETLYSSPLNDHTFGQLIEFGKMVIPANAVPGLTRMRVTCFVRLENLNSTLQGEYEDYAIFIKPPTTLWRVNNVLSPIQTNPLKYYTTTTPGFVGFSITDENGCVDSFNSDTMTDPLSNMSVTLSSTAYGTACYMENVEIEAKVLGGCGPFTYTWKNNATDALLDSGTSNKLTSTFTQTEVIRVEVRSINDNKFASAIINLNVVNPLPNNSWSDTFYDICDRGSAILNLKRPNTTYPDSIAWYNSLSTPFKDYLALNRTYTTPVLTDTTLYYFRVRRLLFASANQGRLFIGATSPATPITHLRTTTNNLYRNFGLAFNAKKDLFLDSCTIFPSTATANGRIRVGVIDRAGNIIVSTPDITLPQGNNLATNATALTGGVRIALKLNVPKNDNLRLVLLSHTSVDSMSISPPNPTTGGTFPYGLGTPFEITSGIGNNQTFSNYLFFYRIRVAYNECFGEARSIPVNVRKAKAPTVFQDLEAKTVCLGSTTNLAISTWNTTKFSYNLYRNNVKIIEDNPTPSFDVVVNGPNRYQIEIISDSACILDTLLKDVLIAPYDTPVVRNFIQPARYVFCENTSINIKRQSTAIENYIWAKVDNGNTLTTVFNSNTDTFKIPNSNMLDDGNYKLIGVGYGNCKRDTSESFRIHIISPPKILDSIYPQNLCEGDKLEIKFRTNMDSMGSDTFYRAFQWYRNNTLMPVTFNSYVQNVSRLSDTGQYFAIMYSVPGCPADTTNRISISISPKPVINFAPLDYKFCEGNEINLISNVTNGDTIRWFKTAFLTQSVNFTKSNAVITDSGQYYFTAKSAGVCPPIISSIYRVKIVKKPYTANITLPDKLLCSNDSIVASFPTFNTISFQWQKNGVNILSANDSILKLKSLTVNDSGTYRLVVKGDRLCSDSFSTSFRVRVSNLAVIDSHPVGGNFCGGERFELRAKVVPEPRAYQWLKDGVAVPNATASSLVLAGVKASDAGRYQLRITNDPPCTATETSNPAEIKIKDFSANPKATEQSVYNAVEQCTDANGWTYYTSETDPDRAVIALRKNGNTISPKLDIIVRSNLFIHRVSNDRENHGSVMGKRYWSLDIGNDTLTEGMAVKHYIRTSEELDLLNRVQLLGTNDPDFKVLNPTAQWVQVKGRPFLSNLLGLVRGKAINFSHEVLFTDNLQTGNEGGTDYIIFSGITTSTGAIQWQAFETTPKLVSSISNAVNSMEINVYPNPSSDGRFSIDIQDPTLGDMNLTIYNAIGQSVFSTPILHRNANTVHPIDLSHMASGNYIIQLISKKGEVSTAKLQINK